MNPRHSLHALARILDWDFEQVIIAHGDVITRNAKAVLREAWRKPLASAPIDR